MEQLILKVPASKTSPMRLENQPSPFLPQALPCSHPLSLNMIDVSLHILRT